MQKFTEPIDNQGCNFTGRVIVLTINSLKQGRVADHNVDTVFKAIVRANIGRVRQYRFAKEDISNIGARV